MFLNERITEKIKKELEHQYFIGIIFILGTIFSILIKGIYLQSTINLLDSEISINTAITKYIFLSSTIMVLSFSIFFPKRFKSSLLVLNILVSIMFFSDALYGRYYGIPLTIPILYQIGFVGDISQSIFSLIKLKDIIFFIDIPVIVGIMFLIRKNKVQINKTYLVARTIIIALLITVSVTKFNSMAENVDKSRHAYQRKNAAKDFGVLYFHGFDVADFINQKIEKNSALEEEEKQIIKNFYENKNKEDTLYTGKLADKNLIVVQVEAMQEFVVDLKIEGKEVTPFLNNLKKQSLYFENIYHQVAGGNTSDAEFLLNNSMYPTATGAVNYLYPTNEFNTLGKILKEKGYSPQSFHGYESSFWNREAVYRNYKYDKFHSLNDFDNTNIRGWAISDKSFFKQVLDKSLINDKFFSFLITLSSHHPYDGFDDIDLNTGKFEKTQVGNYLKSMNYVDSAFKSLFEDLEFRGELDDTIIVIYGDHSGLYQDQRQLVEELLSLDGSSVDWNKIQKVPLWIYGGDIIEPMTIEKAGGQIDITPTVLDMMGLKNPYAIGKSLLLKDEGYVVKRDGTVILDDFYYDNSEKILYDIKTNKSIENSNLLEIIKEKQNELIVSDIILKKDLLNNDKIKEILK